MSKKVLYISKLLFSTLIFLSLFSISAIAAEKSDSNINLDICTSINYELNRVEFVKENYGLNNVDFGTLLVSNPIYAYEYINNTLVDAGFTLYPLTSEGNLVAFMIKDNETNTYQFTTALVNEITTNIDTYEAFAIIYDKNNCYAYTTNNLIILNNISIDNNRDILDQNNLCIPSNIILNNYLPVQSLNYSNNIDSDTMTKIDETNSITTLSNFIYLSVSYVSQNGDTDYCWASSDACIGNYLTSMNLSGQYVAYLTFGSNYNQPASISVALNALNSIYNTSYNSYYSVPSISTMYNILSNGYPIYSVWQFENINYSHAMVIYGVNTTADYVYIMDPLLGFSSCGKVNGEYVYTSTYTGYKMHLIYVGH